MDLATLKFRAGQPILFMTTRPFALGSTGITVPKGTEIYFDGTKATVDGSEYTLPQLRGAIKADWMILAEDYDENASVGPTRANIQVRHPTQGGNPNQPRQAMGTAVSEEEREVGNTRTHAAATKDANSGYRRGVTQVNTGVSAGQKVLTQRGVMEVENQDGHVVDRPALKTASGDKAKQSRVLADHASEVIHKASQVKIEPIAGVSREELMERMDPEERERYEAEIESRTSGYKAEALPGETKAGLHRGARLVDDDRKVVGKAPGLKKSQTTEGITARVSAGSGIETVDLAGASRPAEVTTYEEDGIKFTSTNGPKRDLTPSVHPRQTQVSLPGPTGGVDPEVRRKIAKAMCPEFPDNYAFDLPAKKKIARLRADYEDRMDILKAVFLAESDEMKGMLAQEFPEAFAG